MTRALRLIGDVAYWLGLISLVVGLLLRVAPALALRFSVSSRGGLLLAGCLFLCSLASRAQEKAA